MEPAEPERLGDRGEVVALAALYLYDLLHERLSASVEVVGECPRRASRPSLLIPYRTVDTANKSRTSHAPCLLTFLGIWFNPG
jgi:hypothetical protein